MRRSPLRLAVVPLAIVLGAVNSNAQGVVLPLAPDDRRRPLEGGDPRRVHVPPAAAEDLSVPGDFGQERRQHPGARAPVGAPPERLAGLAFPPLSLPRWEDGIVSTFILTFQRRGPDAGAYLTSLCRRATVIWTKSRCCLCVFVKLGSLRQILQLMLRRKLLPMTVCEGFLQRDRCLTR